MTTQITTEFAAKAERAMRVINDSRMDPSTVQAAREILATARKLGWNGANHGHIYNDLKCACPRCVDRAVGPKGARSGASMKRKIALLMSDDLLLLAARMNITTQKVNEFKSRAATLARISNRYIFAELARRGVKAVRS